MIDRERVLRKLEMIRHHAARMRSKLPSAAQTLQGDEDLRDILSDNSSSFALRA